jgi:ubiquinone/menaquinone biosynthesis C-methylase UbiE
MMFGNSAAYERFMGRWSRQLAPLFVGFAGICDAASVLDVGSGTGSVALAAAERLPAAQVVGVDPSPAYVAYAKTRTPDDRVRFLVGDACQLQFDERSFDAVLSCLVLNFLPDPERALAEMIRVTRPGAVIAAAVWDYSEGMQMLRVFWDEAVASQSAAGPSDERHMRLSQKGQLSGLWRSHRMVRVDEQPLTIELPFASFEDYWSPFLDGQGPSGAHVANLNPEERNALGNRIRRRLLGDGPDRAFSLSARAWAVRGVVPTP